MFGGALPGAGYGSRSMDGAPSDAEDLRTALTEEYQLEEVGHGNVTPGSEISETTLVGRGTTSLS